jgi:CHAT domain-containing protein
MYSKVSQTPDPPRIWWCPTGPLAFLPIHAAGIYNENATRLNVSDYVVSSYTPTLSALISATQSHERHDTFQGLLAVSQPNTHGQPSLLNTSVELKQIKEKVKTFDFHSLEGPAALVKSVTMGMEAHSWVHIACQTITKTMESAVYLYDGQLELSTITTKSFPHADFAFLSQCQTITRDKKQSEITHLAALMMSAGYHSVITTMWFMKEKNTALIVDQVYSDLFSNTKLDSTQAALALHHAVKHLRQQVGDSDFLSWVPIIHVGI